MNVLGISAFYHDSAACLLKDGEIIAAASEERFTRKKHDQGFPSNAIRYVLEEGKVSIGDVEYVGFYDKPIVKFERILSTYVSTFPRSFPSFLKAVPLWLKEKLWVPNTIRRELDYHGEILFGEHHVSHAASAFLVSPYKEAAILTLDPKRGFRHLQEFPNQRRGVLDFLEPLGRRGAQPDRSKGRLHDVRRPEMHPMFTGELVEGHQALPI